MRKLLRAEFYKLRQMKLFWGLLLLSCTFSSVLLMDNQLPRSTKMLFDSTLYNLPLLYILIIAFCSMFIGSDFACHGLQNYITSGHSRCHILAAKMLMSLIACALLLAFPLVADMLAGALIWHDASFQFVLPLLKVMYFLIAMAVLPMMFAFWFQDIGKSMAVSLLVFFLMIFALNSGHAHFFAAILPMGQLRQLALPQQNISFLTSGVADMLWLIGCGTGIFVSFLHADLK